MLLPDVLPLWPVVAFLSKLILNFLFRPLIWTFKNAAQKNMKSRGQSPHQLLLVPITKTPNSKHDPDEPQSPLSKYLSVEKKKKDPRLPEKEHWSVLRLFSHKSTFWVRWCRIEERRELHRVGVPTAEHDSDAQLLRPRLIGDFAFLKGCLLFRG